MEENLKNEKDFEEDFKDFEDGDNKIPDLEQDFMEEQPQKLEYDPNGDSSIFHEKKETLQEETQDDYLAQIEALHRAISETMNVEEKVEENSVQEEQEETNTQTITEEISEENAEEKEITGEEVELSQWEELSKDNSVVKKYILYISKDFIPCMDSLSIDERNAFINDAIQKKLDLEDEIKQQQNKKRLTAHLIITIITICVITPFALLGVNKAILATFNNYKYSQENFEKLYKERFAKDKAYMRSVLYNQEQEKKRNKK